MNKRIPPEVRFSRMIAYEGEHWLWTGAKDQIGYGMFQIESRRSIRTHVFAYQFFCGPIPDGMEVRHTCDIRNCVNPAHLILGTHRQNMQDMAQRKRHPWVKITPDDVREIRRRVAAGETQTDVARFFRIKPCQVNRIINRKRWAHVD